MLYYKVKPTSDQQKTQLRFKNNFLIGSELYTYKEVLKSKHSSEYIEKHLEAVDLKPKQTFFCFGARFKKD